MGEEVVSRKVRFDGAGGRLAGAIDAPQSGVRAAAIFAHCFSCTKDLRAAREIARVLVARGLAVLRFDFAGLGGSEGAFADTSFSANVGDIAAAAAFLEREVGPARLLVGHSLGGAAAIVAAAQISTLAAVATIGAPAETEHVVHQLGEGVDAILRDGEAEVLLAGRPFTLRRTFLEDLDKDRVLAAAHALKKPLLLLHAPLDATVGVENAQAIFTAARHPKSFVSLAGADHLLSNPADARYAAEVVGAWSSRFLGD